MVVHRGCDGAAGHQDLLQVSDLHLQAVPRVSGLRSAAAATVVANVSFAVRRNTITGIVGESGSGKTLTSLAIAGLLPPGVRIAGGRIRVLGVDVTDWSKQHEIQRGRHIGFIFQNPSARLTPVIPIGKQLMEGAMVHRRLHRRAAKELAVEYLSHVGLGGQVDKIMRSYPHTLSGGMLQRVMIAMVLMPGPALLVADEPTASLDTGTQITILELLARLRTELNLTILFVSHQLAAVSNLCDDMVVMQRGRVVEVGGTPAVIRRPQHPYTRALIQSAMWNTR